MDENLTEPSGVGKWKFLCQFGLPFCRDEIGIIGKNRKYTKKKTTKFDKLTFLSQQFDQISILKLLKKKTPLNAEMRGKSNEIAESFVTWLLFLSYWQKITVGKWGS